MMAALWDPLAPLGRVNLIEASAGTGKTYSIAGLYLRLLVEHKLTEEAVAVTTFTEAAAQELKDRLRQWLRRGAALARARARGETPSSESGVDATVSEILDAFADRWDGWSELALHLQARLAGMDHAPVSTIHAFFQRLLREHAFNVDLPLLDPEIDDDSELVDELCRDYWRSRVLEGADPDLSAGVCQMAKGPAELRRYVSELLKDIGVRRELGRFAPPDTEAAPKFEHLREALSGALAAMGRNEIEVLEATLERWIEDKWVSGAKGKLEPELRQRIIAALEELTARPDGDPARAGVLRCLAMPRLEKFKLKNGKAQSDDAFLTREILAVHAIIDAADALAEAQLSAVAQDLRLFIVAGAIRAKLDEGRIGFDDIIASLANAVADPERGATLCQAIRRTCPWALVDEFQDTDRLQFEVFERVYAAGGRDGGLVMIGDPKQAIYGFRGGDVHAYLHAREQVADTFCYRLGTNWRSRGALLEATEALFTSGPGKECFFQGSDIVFEPVRPAGAADRRPLLCDDGPLTPMTLLRVDRDGEPLTGGQEVIRHDLAEVAASELRDLLADAGRGRVGFGEGKHRAPLRPGDVAVLVRDRFELHAMQQACSRRGIKTVSINRRSVFESEEAAHLQQFLEALAEPAREPVLRAALVTPLFGWRASDLADARGDTGAWQTLLERFEAWRERAGRRGIMAVLRPLLQDRSASVLRLDDGERRMTNYLHLADLLQTASTETFGVTGLAGWLADQRGAASGNSEAQQLRMESDEDAVRLVTMHAAKGLEYEVVFLPFTPLMSLRNDSGDAQAITLPSRDGPSVHMGRPDADMLARRRAEDFAELMRLFYVAVTRARQACVINVAALKLTRHRPWQEAPLPYLLRSGSADSLPGPDAATPDALDEGLARLQKVAGGTLSIRPASSDAARLPGSGEQAAGELAARRPERRAADDWSVHSFSRLVTGADLGMQALELMGEQREAGPEPVTLDPALAGADFGTAVHGLFEVLEFTDTAWQTAEADQGQLDLVADALGRMGLLGTDAEIARRRTIQTRELVRRGLLARLPLADCRLADLGTGARRPELEFHFALAGRSGPFVEAVNEHRRQLAAEHGLPEPGPFELAPDRLEGLMNGFIDLVFERDGRYFILDYKTNRLTGDGGYRPAGLARAILDKHFDLQYLLYTVALHRYLKRRLPGYDPARHLGGSIYLFLRGLDGSGNAGAQGAFATRVPETLVRRLNRTLGPTEREAG
ncbi:MAG: UvrD-helicase domain-containing protein [Gammaproteobacteria bacterium]|jgi:exodeoxyribonuclease V beta subunit